MSIRKAGNEMNKATCNQSPIFLKPKEGSIMTKTTQKSMRSIISIAMALVMTLVLVVGFAPTVASASGGHTVEVIVMNHPDRSLFYNGNISFNVNGTQLSSFPLTELLEDPNWGSIVFRATTGGQYSLSVNTPGHVVSRVTINGVEGQSLNLGTISQDLIVFIFVVPGQAPEPTPTPPVTTPTPPVTTPTPPGTTAPNLHTASSWSHELINEAVDIGLVPTQLQNHYRNDISRAEFTALAVLFFELVTGDEITGRIQFNDSNDINVQKAAYLGLVSGTGGGNFSPNMAFNREQASVILDRLATAIGEPFPLIPPTFADTPQMSPWAVQSVGAAQFAGIVGGVGNNMFNPRGAFTIEQSIVTILRLFERHLELTD